MSEDNDVKESAEYDNFIEQSKGDSRPNTLAEFLEEEIQYDEPWQKHWQDMPEFEQEHNKPYKSINVHFRTKEDYMEFQQLIGQMLTEKTKTIWHPSLEVTQNSLLRWIEE